MREDLQRWSPSLTAFCEWLVDVDEATASSWSRRLKSDDLGACEGAVAEAVTWDYFASRARPVAVADILGEGGVDFEFEIQGQHFLIEVTNIASSAASKGSGMPDALGHSGDYGLLTDQIRQRVRKKFRQAKKAQDRSSIPLLVVTTTLHANASAICIDRHAVEFAMGSEPKITMKFNPDTGDCEGEPYQSTDLTRSVFLSPNPILGPDGVPIAHAKYEPISGFVVCGFGVHPPSVFGGLNPVASYFFDPQLLPDIPFCSFAHWPLTSHIEYNWTITETEEREQRKRDAEMRLRKAGYGSLVAQTRDEILRQMRDE